MANNYEKKYEKQKKVSLNYLSQIEELKNKISELEGMQDIPTDDAARIDELYNEMLDVIDNLNDARMKYERLNNELLEMKATINKVFFKNNYKLVKFLLK